jgi:hypothetical protein
MKTPREISEYMSEIGKKGGSVKSPAKTNANRLKALKRWEKEKEKKSQ